MERIGNQKIWSYFDDSNRARTASNLAIRGGSGHKVDTYFQLAMKVAELQFLNRDHVLLFRGQNQDFRTTKRNSMLKASIFRNRSGRVPTQRLLEQEFRKLRLAESELVAHYTANKFRGFQLVKRHRVIRWSILQHYEVCATPLLDVTSSLRIAASFASSKNRTTEAFVFVFGLPQIAGAVTASSETGLQVIRLSSACPPDAVRPHVQEGYLLGEYPEISDFVQKSNYEYWEMDFGRRLLAKFRFNPDPFWKSENYPKAKDAALYPKNHRDPLLAIATKIKNTIANEAV